MPQSASAINPITKISTEDLILNVDFTRLLKAGEFLDQGNTPTVDQLVGDAALIIDTIAVNAAPITDDYGNSIPAGYAVTMHVTGGTPGGQPDGTVYQLRVTAKLNGTTRKRAGLCIIYVPG